MRTPLDRAEGPESRPRRAREVRRGCEGSIMLPAALPRSTLNEHDGSFSPSPPCYHDPDDAKRALACAEFGSGIISNFAVMRRKTFIVEQKRRKTIEVSLQGSCRGELFTAWKSAGLPGPDANDRGWG